MHGGTRLLWLDASRVARDAAPAARDLAVADEHIFPTLRLAPVPGETGLENILRQIDALTQRRLPPPAPPASEPPARHPALRPRLALPPPKPHSPTAPATPRKPERARIALRLGAGALVAFAILLSPEAPFLASSPGSRRAVEASSIAHPAAAPPAAPGLRNGPGVLILAMPPAAAPALAALKPAAGPPSLAAREPGSGASEAAATPRPRAPTTGAGTKAPEQTLPAAGLAAPLLLARGNELLAMGDVVSARQFFARAEASGTAAAARALAATYDPLFLREIGAVGVKPDAVAAASLYRQAAKAGDAAAASRLVRLERETPAPPASGTAATPSR
jgi:hypothetical protein